MDKPADPTRENYSFAGWAKSDNETSALWDFATETVTADMTLYARWSVITHMVSFDSDGGSAVTAQNVANGGTATQPADPTRDGYEFDGWLSGDTEWNFDTAITAPITLKAKWTAVHIVTFNSDGGSAVPAQIIRNGETATKPADSTKEFRPISGLYLGTIDLDEFPSHYTFIEWRKEGESMAFDFNAPITVPVNLIAVWEIPIALTPIASVPEYDVAAVVTYVNANSNSGEQYTFLLGSNAMVGEQTLNGANAKLTIIGIGAERTITSTTIRLFTINGNNATNLTLGKNITLKCGNTGVGLISISDKLVRIQRGSLTMRDGSKITGLSGHSGAVFVGGLNASFKMEGGEISENNSNFINSSGGVYVSDGGTFEMSGGSITGNTTYSSAEDIFIDYDCTFNLSGSARIGTLMLNANNATTRSSVTIAGIYNGTVTRLHLCGEEILYLNTVVTWWTNAPVIINGTASVINMFNDGLGDFRTSPGYGYNTLSISATHQLNTSGVLVLK